MTAHPERRPGRLYVVLGSAFDHDQHSHVEPFVEVEDHEGRGSGDVRDFPEKGCRLLEFPSPAAHAALEAERDADRAMSVAFGKKLLEADAANAAAVEALEAWAEWWNGLPRDEQVRDHDAAYAAITATRAALAGKAVQP